MPIRKKSNLAGAGQAVAALMETDEDRERWLAENERVQSDEMVKVFNMMGRREDVNEFCAYVGRDAETGKRIVHGELHEAFQELATRHDRLIVMAFPESGKTSQLGILRVLWELGRNPSLRVAVLSKTQPTAAKTVRTIKQYIEKSTELREVFPELKPGEKWEETFFTINRPVFSKDPTVQALGLESAVIGSRIDLLILDDVLDDENTSTPAGLAQTIKRIRSGYLDRLTTKGRAIFLTNAWNPGDAAHVFGREGWMIYRFPVRSEDGVYYWPEKWNDARVDKVSQDLGPLESGRSLFCKPRADGESPFDKDKVEAAYTRADELELVHRLDAKTLPEGAAIVHGIDLAHRKQGSGHLTSISTVLLWTTDWSYQLLWIEAGRWSSSEIRDRVLDHTRRYDGLFVIENNAAQDWIFDIIMNQAHLPQDQRVLPKMVPFTTGTNKAHPQFGVEGLAVEIRNGLWLFPTHGPAEVVKQAQALKGEMLYYTRGGHTGDRLMSLWFAREGLRRGINAGRPEDKGPGKDLTPPEWRDDGNVGAQVLGERRGEDNELD